MKRTLAAIITLLWALAALAQVGVGARLGVGFNTVTANRFLHEMTGDKPGYMCGPVLGVMVDCETVNWLSLQAELNYAMRGCKEEFLLFEGDVAHVKFASSYLELPLLAKVYPFGQSGFNIQVGPQVGLLLGRHLSADREELDLSLLKGKDRRLDFGLNFGLGYGYKRWSFDARYYLGLTDTYTSQPDNRNRGFTFAVGYFFR